MQIGVRFFTLQEIKFCYPQTLKPSVDSLFSLYLIDLDGKSLERVTHGKTFDAFTVFSSNGKYLAFSSNRNNGSGRDTNLFIADWQD